MFYGNQQIFQIIYRSIVICFPSCVCVLQNEYVSIARSFKYDSASRSFDGRWFVGRWVRVGARLVGGSVVHGGTDEKTRKNMFGVEISPVHLGRDLFCYSNFNFLYIDDKEETNLITRSSRSNLKLFLKICNKYDKFKQNKPTTCCDFKSFFYL